MEEENKTEQEQTQEEQQTEEQTVETIVKEFTKQIEELKQQIADERKAHTEEIKKIVQSVNLKEEKTEFDKQVESVINAVNKYRK